MINQICERSILVEALASTLGFSKIRKKIKDTQSLDEPHGEWFQLVVGYILKSIGEQLVFEQPINGNPKDILLQNGTINVECKSFGIGKATEVAINDFIDFGKVPNIGLDSPNSFTVKHVSITAGWNPVYYYVDINEYSRLVSNGIDEKYHQLPDGICNLLAFNTYPFTSNLRSIQEPLIDILRNHARISGFFILQKEPLSQETLKLIGDVYKLLGSAYTIDLIKNPTASIQVPEGLSQDLTLQLIKIALRK